MTNIEIWKDIPKFEGLYQASSLGRIKSTKTNRILKQRLMRGYCRVCLCKQNNKSHHFVHRLIAITFINNAESKPFINHKNGIRNNNNILNLQWVTNSENQKHSYKELGRIHTRPLLGRTGILCKNSKKVLQYDLSGNLINSWDAIADVVRNFKFSQSSISQCCLGNKKTAYGYKWEYAI